VRRNLREYLQAGGLFNPELMDHQKVSELWQDAEHNLMDSLTKTKAVVEYCYDHLDKMWAAKVTSILLGCDFRDAKEHADEFFKWCEEEGVE
jgi:hypothetical protein